MKSTIEHQVSFRNVTHFSGVLSTAWCLICRNRTVRGTRTGYVNAMETVLWLTEKVNHDKRDLLLTAFVNARLRNSE